MSRGPGYVERAIAEAFAQGKHWTVSELCRWVWPNLETIEKTHRMSVGRASRRVAARSPGWKVLRQHTMRGSPVIYMCVDDNEVRT